MKTKGDNLNKKRVDEYDLLRVIATVLVVIGHSCYLIMGGVRYEVQTDVSWVYDSNLFRIVRFISGWAYGFHMPLFFPVIINKPASYRPCGIFNKRPLKP